MTKKMIVGLVLVLMLFGVYACSSDQSANFEDAEDGSTVTLDEEASVPERKIIYSVDMTITATDAGSALEDIKTLMETDEWLDSESVTDDEVRVTLRIRSDRLDPFIEAINADHSVTRIERTATDISLGYQDVSARIDALEAEEARLVELYGSASLSDMITINERLTELTLELAGLQGELDMFDSLSDYSTVTIRINESAVPESVGFLRLVVDGFLGGVDFVIAFARGLAVVVATLVPVMVVGLPVGYGILKLVRRYERKQRSRRSKDGDDTSKEQA